MKTDNDNVYISLGLIFGFALIFGVIYASSGFQPVERKPRIHITAKGAGESTGKVVGGFSQGFVKGVVKSFTGEKK